MMYTVSKICMVHAVTIKVVVVSTGFIKGNVMNRGKRCIFRKKAQIVLNQPQGPEKLIDEAELGIDHPAPHRRRKGLRYDPRDDGDGAKSAPPGNGFIQRQRNNRSAQYDAEHAEKNIDNGDPNAGQKLWASQILKIFKAVPFFKALNDVGITQ